MAMRSLALALLLVIPPACAIAAAQDPDKPPPPDTQDPMRDEDEGQDPQEAPPPMPPSPVQEAPKIDVEDLAKRSAAGPPEESAAGATWSERLARDKHVTFTARSATDASAALDLRGGATALRRAAAWMTLGCVGSPADRPRLEAEVRVGKGLERQAAILGLGEFAWDETALLGAIAEDTDAAASESAILALLRSKRPAARERVEAIAQGAKGPRASAAAALIAFDRDPSQENAPHAARLLIDLRWEAARMYGGIDGKNFRAARLTELSESKEFLSELVLRAGARLPGAAPKDHVLSILLEGTGDARLVAMVDAAPRSLSRLVDSGLWKPKDVGEWSVLLAEIERERVELSCPELLARAEEDVEELRWTARSLLARAGRVDVESFSSIDVPGLEEKDCVLACQVLGCIQDPGSRAILARLADDRRPNVRGAALAARFRIGDTAASATLDPILDDRNREEHAALVQSLCRNVREPLVASRLEKYMRKAVGEELAAVAAALCEQDRNSGRLVARSLLFLDSPPTGARRRLLVRALCRRPSAEDREALLQAFPQPREEGLNRELAIALTVLDDPVVHPLLRSALWSSSFDQGVLAGMLFYEEAKMRGMIEEIANPPASARPVDLRRAGFALGEWGGIAALQALVDRGGSKASPEIQGVLLGVLGARTQ
jgi:hypothetical protein